MFAAYSSISSGLVIEGVGATPDDAVKDAPEPG